MSQTTYAPDARKRLLAASLVLAAGMLLSAALTILDAAWAALGAAGVMVAALLTAGLLMRPVVPVGWAPVAASGIMGAGVLVGAGLLLPDTDVWSTIVISGGAFFVVLMGSPKDATGWQTVTGAVVLAAALVIAIWT